MKVDRQRFPHDYVGPATPHGLKPDTPCRIIARRAGNVVSVTTKNGRSWFVPSAHVKKAAK